MTTRRLERVAQVFVSVGGGEITLFEVPANTRFTLRSIDIDSNGYEGARFTVYGGGGTLADHILLDAVVPIAHELLQYRFNLPFYAGEIMRVYVEPGVNGAQGYLWVAGIVLTPTDETAPDWSA